MSDTGIPTPVTFDQYVSNVASGFQAARDALQRTDARLREELGGPDPDVSTQNEAVLAFLDEMAAVAPADVAPGEPVTDTPLPEVPVTP